MEETFYREHIRDIEEREQNFRCADSQPEKMASDPRRQHSLRLKSQLRSLAVPQPVHVQTRLISYSPHFKPSVYYYKVSNITFDETRKKDEMIQRIQGPKGSQFTQKKSAYQSPQNDKVRMRYSYRPQITIQGQQLGNTQKYQFQADDQKAFLRDLLSPRRQGMFSDIKRVESSQSQRGLRPSNARHNEQIRMENQPQRMHSSHSCRCGQLLELGEEIKIEGIFRQ